MTIKEFLKNKILKFLGLEKLADNPNDQRYTFINDDEALKIEEIKANRVWYIGDGNELLNFYTGQQLKGFFNNPIYNRNKRNYFWSLSATECAIKRVHSGVPHAIIDTLTNIVGMPKITEPTGIWEKIAEENDFSNKLTQQARPLTLAEGYGAWKINFNKELSDKPLWEYYEAEAVEYIYKSGILVGIIFKSFYKKKNTDYILFETRYKGNGNSYIEFNLYKLAKSNQLEEVSKTEIEELKSIPDEPIVIEGLNKVLGVPSRYFYDVSNPKYGRSIYAGKLDLFDFLDEILSQASQTNRVSTPVEYYSPDVLERGQNGGIGVPNLYNRQFIQKAGVPDGEGNMSQDIITTQPDLNFDRYGELEKDILGNILTGVLSPSTFGIDIAKKDNAEAQREKEKVSIMTRNNIITAETKMLKEMVLLSLYMQEYMSNGTITLKDYEIDVKYNEFANPTTENLIQSLLPMLVQGGISPELFVEKIYGDSLGEEAKSKEIAWITKQLEQGELNIDKLLENNEN